MMRIRFFFMSILAAIALSIGMSAAEAEIRLPQVLSDHAVLQRNRPIHIWGWASPGAPVSVKFHEQKASTVANELGKWSLWLKPELPGGPYVLTASEGASVKTVTDLLVGDVWFASGQSNMQMPLEGFPGNAVVKDAEKEIAGSANPNLRLLYVEMKSSDVPLDDTASHWTTCTPQTAAKFSAVAYFFGREIAAKEHVPIGLIDSTWGGTPVDSWMSLDTLGNHPELFSAFSNRAKFAALQVDVTARAAAEKREDEAAKAAGKPVPFHTWHPYEVSWLPAGLYNAMVAPLTPYSIRGFLWYQGETDSTPSRAPYYRTLFPALIADWRMQFAQGMLPFLFVQLSSFHSPHEDWGTIREAQRQALSVANTAMAVSLDLGTPENVHPPDKQDVSARLALAARSLVYGEKIAYQSPLFREVSTELTSGGTTVMRVWFDHAEGLTSRDQAIEGFELAGEDHHFYPATALIDGESVVVTSKAVPHPYFVRYDWMNVAPPSIYNAAGLPAGTFSSENIDTK